MPTIVERTIGTGGDYSTLQAWEDAAPSNLVAADQVWKGLVKAGQALSSELVVDGSTSDATRYKWLTVEAGGAWCDNSANAIRYDASQGARLSGLGEYSVPISGNENYFRLSRLQIDHQARYTRPLSLGQSNVIIEQVLSLGRRAAYVGGVATNCVFLRMNEGDADNATLMVSGAAQIRNCLVAFCASSDATTGVVGNYASSAQIRNSVCVGHATNFPTPGGGQPSTYQACYQSGTTTSISGVTNGLAYTSGTFASVTRGTMSTMDFRLVAGSALIDTGATLSGVTADAFGTSRPAGSAYDVGPHELVTASGTNLVASDTSHAHLADAAPTSTQLGLALAEAAHAHGADAAPLSTLVGLSTADALHAHLADTLALSTQQALMLADALHAHLTDAPAPSTQQQLAVVEAAHAHSADSALLGTVGSAPLTLADAAHAHTVDSASLTTLWLLTVAGALHQHAADSALLGTTGSASLALADALHGQSADLVAATVAAVLSVQEALHTHQAEDVLVLAGNTIQAADALHAVTAAHVDLVTQLSLLASDTRHSHTADIVLFSLYVWTVAAMFVDPERNVMFVEPEGNLMHVQAD